MKAWSKAWTGAACAAVLGMATSAQAHDLTCTKRVNGQAAVTAATYPFTANYSFEVTNTHPTLPSLLLTALDPLLLLKGFSFPELPILIPVGESITQTLAVVLDSFDDCETLALLDGNVDANFDNSFTATFDLGLSVSTARVTCGPATPDLTCGAATRTLGYYQSHLVPLTACLLSGTIDLGPVAAVTTDISVQGILWGNPDRYLNGDPRNELDRARFLLAQQVLEATCNQRLFSRTPPDNLLSDARASLAGVACGGMETFTNRLRAFNASCAAGPFPLGFISGPATPLAARALGVDPSLPTPGGCAQ